MRDEVRADEPVRGVTADEEAPSQEPEVAITDRGAQWRPPRIGRALLRRDGESPAETGTACQQTRREKKEKRPAGGGGGAGEGRGRGPKGPPRRPADRPAEAERDEADGNGERDHRAIPAELGLEWHEDHSGRGA